MRNIADVNMESLAYKQGVDEPDDNIDVGIDNVILFPTADNNIKTRIADRYSAALPMDKLSDIFAFMGCAASFIYIMYQVLNWLMYV